MTAKTWRSVPQLEGRSPSCDLLWVSLSPNPRSDARNHSIQINASQEQKFRRPDYRSAADWHGSLGGAPVFVTVGLSATKLRSCLAWSAVGTTGSSGADPQNSVSARSRASVRQDARSARFEPPRSRVPTMPGAQRPLERETIQQSPLAPLYAPPSTG